MCTLLEMQCMGQGRLNLMAWEAAAGRAVWWHQVTRLHACRSEASGRHPPGARNQRLHWRPVFLRVPLSELELLVGAHAPWQGAPPSYTALPVDKRGPAFAIALRMDVEKSHCWLTPPDQVDHEATAAWRTLPPLPPSPFHTHTTLFLSRRTSWALVFFCTGMPMSTTPQTDCFV